MGKIEFTIVIPTYNESRDLGDCLKSIANQDYPKDKFEVIIVDNYSKDNTLDIAKSFSEKINLRTYLNPIKDAEVSKMLGFRKSKGTYFMYLDADMRFSDSKFISKMLFPFSKNKEVSGVFVKFLVNQNHSALTRTLSYDEWQRDPIFKFFTTSVSEIIKEKRENYYLCICDKYTVPPQGLMIYRKSLIKDYAKNQKQLIDNEIPALLVSKGHNNFAFVPETGVYHLILRNLKELSHKRIRNLQRTYYPNKDKRLFTWINWKKDWPKIGIWLLYTNSIFLPVLSAIIKSLKHKDFCFLNEPILNMVSTYSIIYGVLSNFNNGKRK
jgi:glycosyltransferase involved in cell wall biosynthesis